MRSWGLLAKNQRNATEAASAPEPAANHQGMRWKRYLFKELCNRKGGLLCKSPNCGVCSDYAFCFGAD